MNFSFSLLLGLLAVTARCREVATPRFTRLTAAQTGIRFNNQITENDSLNVLDFEYIYNGGGVGVGDFDNDGRPDIFLSGNQVPSKLYLNRGNFRFEDITLPANIRTPYWSTGVSVVDINQDGWLDIYLCTANPGSRQGRDSPNQLFVNQGLNRDRLPTFREVAASAGLADSSYSTQAAFLDYDRDGDLDVYLLNNALESFDRSLPLGQRKDGTGKSNDRLYRNDGGTILPHFTDVSRVAGITTEGWGLGVAVADLNADGWPDVYCANDFQSNDLLWINNRDGTFTNRIADCLRHQSANSMGVDVADLNNDGLPEIMTLDMMPEDNLRQKALFSKPNYDRYQLNLEHGYQPQFVRNSLQLNNSPDPRGNPMFSEIGYLAGVYATDWSWAALLADFDNDGYRDLLVTNGYRKDITNLDFASYGQNNPLGVSNPQPNDRRKRLRDMGEMLGAKKSNFVFRNQGNLTFEDVTQAWGLKRPSYSNGAAYADLDNDGDLDLVINDLDDEALVYRNNTRAATSAPAGQAPAFLKVKLAGAPGNRNGLGAKVTLYCAEQQRVAEHSPYRGYASSVELGLHFGLGKLARVDSLRVVWPGGKQQTLKNVPVNQTVVMSEAAARHGTQPNGTTPGARPPAAFTEVSAAHRLDYTHRERDFVDFKYQNLLPHQHSQLGPGLAVGDVNGDGREDVFIGGSVQQSGTFFRQLRDGTFEKTFLEDTLRAKPAEDTGALLFDADNDGDNDLYCVSGSSEFGKNARYYQDRFYRNQGQGRFQLDSAALPVIESSGSCVVGADYDRDGDNDLFVGGRVSPQQYPVAPRSYLLQNDGHGHFTDVTPAMAPPLQKPGMVTAALWSDYDRDGWVDLVLVGEFMPISFFRNQKGTFRSPPLAILHSVGWWNSLAAGDFDNDGDTDYAAGNLGLNSLYQASEKEPVCVYAKDYDQSGTLDPVLCRYVQGNEYITHYRENLTDQLPGLKKVLTSYQLYGEKTFQDIFTDDMRKGALVLRATCFASAYLENLGNGAFVPRALPQAAQLAPTFGMDVTDVDHDGNLDLLTVGNDYSAEPLTGRYDAAIGTCLRGDGRGNFAPMVAAQSGFVVRGDAKALATVGLADGKWLWLITQNRDKLLAFEGKKSRPAGTYSPQPLDAYADITLASGKKRRQEFYYGGGYLSQSSRRLAWPADARAVRITTTQGIARDLAPPPAVLAHRAAR